METYLRLEKEYARWVGEAPSQVVTCATGTDAIYLAITALGIPEGSAIIVPDFSMVACARAIRMAGCIPVFADVSELGLIRVSEVTRLLENLGNQIGGILAVHTYGRRCDISSLSEIAYQRGIPLIEDCAEYHGGPVDSSLSSARCWSFYRNKIVSGEEGGAVAFRHPLHADNARQLRCLGFTEAHDFTHVPRGISSRMSNAHAGLILNSLRTADVAIRMRRQMVRAYNRYLPGSYRLPYREVPWVYDFRISGMEASQQDSLVQLLIQQGINARHSFKPLSSQEEFRRLAWHGDCPTATRLSREVIYLPLDPMEGTAGIRERSEIVRKAIQETVGAG